MRAAATHSARLVASRPIPLLLVRDLVAIALLTEPRPFARSRLDALLGVSFADRLVDELADSTRRVA